MGLETADENAGTTLSIGAVPAGAGGLAVEALAAPASSEDAAVVPPGPLGRGGEALVAGEAIAVRARGPDGAGGVARTGAAEGAVAILGPPDRETEGGAVWVTLGPWVRGVEGAEADATFGPSGVRPAVWACGFAGSGAGGLEELLCGLATLSTLGWVFGSGLSCSSLTEFRIPSARAESPLIVSGL